MRRDKGTHRGGGLCWGGALLTHLLEKAHENVSRERALVRLVEDDAAVAVQQGVGHGFAKKHTVGAVPGGGGVSYARVSGGEEKGGSRSSARERGAIRVGDDVHGSEQRYGLLEDGVGPAAVFKTDVVTHLLAKLHVHLLRHTLGSDGGQGAVRHARPGGGQGVQNGRTKAYLGDTHGRDTAGLRAGHLAAAPRGTAPPEGRKEKKKRNGGTVSAGRAGACGGRGAARRQHTRRRRASRPRAEETHWGICVVLPEPVSPTSTISLVLCSVLRNCALCSHTGRLRRPCGVSGSGQGVGGGGEEARQGRMEREARRARLWWAVE